MSGPSEHPAHKGCYVVIGQHDHTDYLVGHYISISQARKAARNKARMAGADTSTCSDVFCVYDDAENCHARITFDDLPDHLRHPNARLEMPEALPPPKRYYDREFILFLLVLLVIPLLWWAKGFYDDMELSEQDKVEYAQLRKRFDHYGPDGNCERLDWERHGLWQRRYERELESPTLPRPRVEYLKDKLRYYEDTSHRGPDVIGLVAEFARAELALAQPGEIVAPDAIYAANRNKYLEAVKVELPLLEELAGLVSDMSGPDMTVVTNLDYRKLQRALALCEQIRQGVRDRSAPFGYLLDGGNGKEVPIDGYEAEAFAKMIATSLDQKDVQRTNTLFQALISYQVMNWDVYSDAVQDSITQYSHFLAEQEMDSPAQAAILEARLLKLNPYEYSQEYKGYRERTLRFLRTTLTASTSAPGNQ